jgi:hypothetical protein
VAFDFPLLRLTFTITSSPSIIFSALARLSVPSKARISPSFTRSTSSFSLAIAIVTVSALTSAPE